MSDPDWNRIEPHSRDPGIEEGLAARIADPLWMLARQWQVGEFRGEDAASPIWLKTTVMHAPLTRFRNEAAPLSAAATEPMPVTQPLESLVEAQALPTPPGRFAMAAAGGLDFLRRLDEADLARLRQPLRERFPLAPPDGLRGLPAIDLARIDLASRRSLDAFALAAALAADLEALTSDSTEAAVLTDLWRRWRQRSRERYALPPTSGETWVPEHLEHSFSLACDHGESETVLAARQYAGGRLDWHSFDIDPQGRFGDRGKPVMRSNRRSLETLAVPLAFPGMPAARFWEFEEGSVYYGGIEAGPADLARLLVAEFATIASDNWLLVPLRLPIGHLARVEEVVVRNTFGETHRIRSCAAWDQARRPGHRDFGLFELTGDASAAAGKTPWLALVPSLHSTLHGEPLESVSFVRDEAANLAWAVEERIEVPSGRALRRRLTASLEPGEPSTEPGVPSDQAATTEAGWRYRLQSRVPPYWIPLLPEPIAHGSAEVRLRRARLLAWDDLPDPSVAGVKGLLLEPTRPLALFEEEVPSGGLVVTRRWQWARGPDGRPYLWLARSKQPGRGERASGLRFDNLLPRAAAAAEGE